MTMMWLKVATHILKNGEGGLWHVYIYRLPPWRAAVTLHPCFI